MLYQGQPRILVWNKYKTLPVLSRDTFCVDVTSHGSGPFQQLSPFFLGPLPLYGEYHSEKMENAWQYAKLFPSMADEEGNPLPTYWDWAQAGWKSKVANRYPLGKGVRPLCHFWEGEKLGFVEARKRIYVPGYVRCAEETKAYTILYEKYQKGIPLCLLDFDGYNIWNESAKRELTAGEIVSSPKTLGHAYVLKFMLEDTVTEAISEETECTDKSYNTQLSLF